MIRLLSIGHDAKTVKGEKIGVLTGILYLAPSDESGVMNTCPHASPGCRAVCLYTAGRGAFANVKAGRVKKTLWFVNDRQGFMEALKWDVAAVVRKAKRENMVPAIRLNGTSDIPWESIKLDGKSIMEHFPDIQFYDYTKNPSRAQRFSDGLMPANYHLTFSKSETNQVALDNLWNTKVSVAVVFRGGLPATYRGREVIDGDLSDVRFNDPKGCIVGLKAKGKARKADEGFVVQVRA